MRDRNHHWRILYRIDQDAIVIVDVVAKKTGKTPVQVIEKARSRLGEYDEIAAGEQ